MAHIIILLWPTIFITLLQVFDMKTITAVGHEVGAMVGWDLAHAVGNVPIKLHQWDADFAVWCSYKVRDIKTKYCVVACKNINKCLFINTYI